MIKNNILIAFNLIKFDLICNLSEIKLTCSIAKVAQIKRLLKILINSIIYNQQEIILLFSIPLI